MHALALPAVAALLTTPCLPDILEVTGFRPGPYSVGLRSFQLVDTARPWPSTHDPSERAGRPVPLALWYPSEATTAPAATLEDLIVADAVPSGDAVSRAGRAGARARPAFETALGHALGPGEWRRLLDLPVPARLGTAPRSGRRALLLLEGGLGSRSFALAPIAALLASHGYVVAALATAGAGETKPLDFDLAGLRTQVDDMKFALSWLAARNEVDASRVGLVAWSVGGVSQALLRLERPEAFRAAVSLDSGSGYAYGAALLREAGGVDEARLRTPFLHVDVGLADVEVPKDDSFLRAHPPDRARRVRLDDLRHADFTLPYRAGRVAVAGEPVPPGLRRLGDELVGFLTDHLPANVSSERVRIPSAGWNLVGDLARPDRPDTTPAVLLLNKAAGSREAYRRLAEELARRGMASLRIDLRAHGESTNLGRFVPPDGLPLLEGSDQDVAAALDSLRHDPRIDGSRLAVVGASYSGEVMMEAARKHGFVAAYVGLSPGSLSDESIAAIDRQRLAWLLVVSRDERHLKEVEQALREESRTAELWELPGTLHATDLLAAHPALAPQLAVWLERRLAPVLHRPR